MSEATEIYRLLADHRREEKVKNRAKGMAALQRSNLPYVLKNGGDHVVITHPTSKIDFWPTTRRWKIRKGKIKGFGFLDLLKELN